MSDPLRPAISRRSALLGAAAVLSARAVPATAARLAGLAEIEASLGGRLGVAALNLRTEATLGHRADERFAMCSTFKWALAAQVLAEVQRGRAALNEPVRYSQADLQPHSPVTGPRLPGGSMTLAELCAAAIEVSDNTAANLLLRRMGGPAGYTAFLRRTGDTVTRLDRWETELNENAPGDPRDTTTPAATVASMRRLLFGDLLSAFNRELLQGWMRASTTAPDRLRAGFPRGWIVGDKSGTGERGAYNDVCFALPRRGAQPILVAAYIDAPQADGARAAAAHAAIARLVAARLG